MGRTSLGLVVLALAIFAATPSLALDYFIDYAFEYPLGQRAGTDWRLGDSITYRADTGIVTYHVDVVGSSYSSWWPPDLASRSGVLLQAPFVEEASPSSFYPGQLLMQTNVEIEGTVVPGSNSVGPRYDGYAHWPFSIGDPQVLAIWGPLGMPHSLLLWKNPAARLERGISAQRYLFLSFGRTRVCGSRARELCNGSLRDVCVVVPPTSAASSDYFVVHRKAVPASSTRSWAATRWDRSGDLYAQRARRA